MPLDKLVLILVIIGALLWVSVLFMGLVAALPYGLPVLLIVGLVGYIFFRVLRDRLTSSEDDYYEKNVEK